MCMCACWSFFFFCFSSCFWNLISWVVLHKSVPFPKPDPCRYRNSCLPLSILQLVWKLFLTRYMKHLCTILHLEAFAKVPFLFSYLLSVSWQIWWITRNSSEMWPSVAISTTARWENFQLLGTGFLFVPAHFFSPQSHRLGFEATILDLPTPCVCGGGALHA